MNKPLKYNWFALFSLAFLAMAIFFAAMTDWHVGRSNDSPGLDSAMAGQAEAPDRNESPVGTGNFTADDPAGVRAGKPRPENIKPAGRDSLSILMEANADYWRDLSDADRNAGNDTARPSACNKEDRPGKKPISDGKKETETGIAAGSKGKGGDKLVSSPGKYQVRVNKTTDDQAVLH